MVRKNSKKASRNRSRSRRYRSRSLRGNRNHNRRGGMYNIYEDQLLDRYDEVLNTLNSLVEQTDEYDGGTIKNIQYEINSLRKAKAANDRQALLQAVRSAASYVDRKGYESGRYSDEDKKDPWYLTNKKKN